MALWEKDFSYMTPTRELAHFPYIAAQLSQPTVDPVAQCGHGQPNCFQR